MTLNVCINQGYLGSLTLTPSSYSTELSSSNVEYTLIINSNSPNSPIDISGEVNISSSNSLETGVFDFQFSQQQITLYSITKKQNGFNFIVDNQAVSSYNDLPISFTLRILNFYDNYEGSLVVDTYSQEYGSIVSPIEINPPIEQSLIDSEGADEETDGSGGDAGTGAGGGGTTLPDLVKLGEYNFYSKQYEETQLSEQNLLNINANYTSKQVEDYFKLIEEKNYPLNFLHSSDYIKQTYPKFDKQKFLFPMYVENKFATDNTKTQLTTFLNKLGLLDYFCALLASRQDYVNSGKKIENLISLSRSTEFDSSKILYTKQANSRQNIISFLVNSFQKQIFLLLLEREIFNINSGQKVLKSFYDNQILMYKVSKFKLSDLINPLSHQYFINIFENDELTYFDTQVKYDISYQYRFYKIEIVGGIIKETEIENYKIENIKIVDSPPLPPDIVYIPYKGIDDKILINFNASSGKYVDYPIPVKTSDITIFNNIIEHSSYNLSLKEQRKIQFETDDDYGTFELYRLDIPPKSYTDFDNGMLTETIDGSIEDHIEPNKKYYYIARIKDIHNNISNPTKPIEIEMINENGTIFLLKKEYMFTEQNKVFSKTIKNLLQIKLNPEQTAIDQVATLSGSLQNPPRSANDVIDNLKLSTKETKIWGKQFLMRVTSKNTGKKIDVKFRFYNS